MSAPLGQEPAYPLQVTSALTGWTLANHGGLSKREWLAGTIAAGMWASDTWLTAIKSSVPANKFADAMTSTAIEAADALLARLQASAAPTQPPPTPEPPKAR
jgi:hypothetical protein